MTIDVKSLEEQTGLTGLSGYEAKYLAKAAAEGRLSAAVVEVRDYRSTGK